MFGFRRWVRDRLEPATLKALFIPSIRILLDERVTFAPGAGFSLPLNGHGYASALWFGWCDVCACMTGWVGIGEDDR